MPDDVEVLVEKLNLESFHVMLHIPESSVPIQIVPAVA